MTDKDKSAELLFVYRVVNLRRYFRLSSITYFGLALIATLATQIFCVGYNFFFPDFFSVAFSSFPQFLILLILRFKRNFICKIDFRIHKYHKYNYPLLLILIIVSIPFSIRSIANAVNRTSCPGYTPIGYIIIIVGFLSLGLIYFLVSLKKYSAIEKLLHNKSEEKFAKRLFNKKELTNISKFENLFLFFISWPIVFYPLTVFFYGIFYFFLLPIQVFFLGGINTNIDFFLEEIIFYSNIFIPPLIYTYLVCANKSFNQVKNDLKNFWKFNIKHSPLVKIYRFIRNKFRNK